MVALQHCEPLLWGPQPRHTPLSPSSSPSLGFPPQKGSFLASNPGRFNHPALGPEDFEVGEGAPGPLK